jgi:hypothetical protein
VPVRENGTDPGGIMRLLLTSAGVTNRRIRHALEDLLGKPISESTSGLALSIELTTSLSRA